MGIDNIDHIQQDFSLINNFISINDYYSALQINVLYKNFQYDWCCQCPYMVIENSQLVSSVLALLEIDVV